MSKIAYKLVRSDFGSLNDYYKRVIYTEEWQEIPGEGAFCSETGEGICVGGMGEKLIQVEVKEEREKPSISGVHCWGWVRRVKEIPLPEEWGKARKEYLKAREVFDKALEDCDKGLGEYVKAREKCERIVLDVIGKEE